MGIRGGVKNYLVRDILDLPNSGVERVHLSKFRGKRIVVDWANIAYRFLSRSISLTQFKNEFINLIHKFAKVGIELIFVFDGKPREEKQFIIEHRKITKKIVLEKINNIIKQKSNLEEDFEKIIALSKRVITIKLEHLIECKRLFDLYEIKYIHLEDIEADNIFKFLIDNNVADICFSGDMDLIAFGCKKIILDLNFKEDTIIEIDYEMLINYLGVSSTQLLMAFILSGTDWNNSLKKSNFIKNIELIKTYGDISSIIENLDKINQYMPIEKHIGIPTNRFDWQFSIYIYTETLSSDNITKIKKMLTKQEEHFKKKQTRDIYYALLEFGKSLINHESNFKYIYKFEECIFWKYKFHLNIRNILK